MASINRTQIENFLTAVGDRCEPSSTLFLLGGCALALLDGTRPTLDLDYVGPEQQITDLQKLMTEIATDMQIEIEAVPIEEFVPLPQNAHRRAIIVGHFGNLAVYIFDPYTIALSKLDRGLESDIEDIVFLVRQKIIDDKQLGTFMEAAIVQAEEFLLNAKSMRQHLEIVRRML